MTNSSLTIVSCKKKQEGPVKLHKESLILSGVINTLLAIKEHFNTALPHVQIELVKNLFQIPFANAELQKLEQILDF